MAALGSRSSRFGSNRSDTSTTAQHLYTLLKNCVLSGNRLVEIHLPFDAKL